MSSVLKVDQIQSDTGTVNVSSNLQFSGSSSTLQIGNALYLANTNNFALQFQPDVSGRLRIASSASTFGDNNPFIIERPSSASAQNDAITIRSGGVVDLGKGQLKFPASQNASSDPNTLDDYEEGTYTITTNANLTPNAAYTVWRYIKIGNFVQVNGLLLVGSVSGSNAVTISIPFVSAPSVVNGADSYVGSVMYNGVSVGNRGLVVYLSTGSSSSLTFYNLNDNAGWTQLSNSSLANNDELYVTLTYQTA